MSQHTQDAAHHDPHRRSSMDITEAMEEQHASEQATRALASRLRGELLLPEKPNYEACAGYLRYLF